ncbi:MAG TPA: DNA replication/repair protein RecF [Chloroflexota bacterium]|nr:DNA replication/repair protein RecF [Chloroflexota bacterium]
MLLQRLKLRHFRTYRELDLRLAPGITLLHGPNAAGKTNVLEALFCLGTTKSFRARTDRELITWGEQEEGMPRFARLEADATANGGPVRVEMAIAEQPGAVEASIRKQFKLNGKPSRAGDVVGAVKVVLFSPDDVSLISGSPSGRRRYMDLMLCQIDHRYLRLMQEYGRIVTQRNSLLQRLRGKPDPATLLEFWDERLIAAGVEIIATRRKMLGILNDFAREAYADLSSLGEELQILYRPSLEDAEHVPEIRLAETFRRRLETLQTKEIYQGVTLVGPHRDDLSFEINGVDAQSYGSRGQQRTIALSLRLAELRYMTNRTGEQPILLLDEALAELDEGRRRLLLRLMESHPQVIATTSNINGFPQEFRDRATLLYVEEGTIGVTPPVRARAV